VQVDSPSLRSRIGDRYVSERAFDLDSKEDIELVTRLISRDNLEVCFVAPGSKGPCTGYFGLSADVPQVVRNALQRELDGLISYHRELPSRNPQQAIAEYNNENPMEDTPVLSPQLESRKLSGKTEEEALDEVVSSGIARESIHEIRTTRPEREKVAEGEGNNPEEAIANAKSDIPPDAVDIGPPEMVREAEHGTVEIQAQSEEEARERWESQKAKDATLDDLICMTQPRRGFIGIGRRLGIWEVTWSRPSVVRFSYRVPAEVSVTWLKQTE
jgi:hypothetical protein